MTKNCQHTIATPDANLLVEEAANHALTSIIRLMARHAAREVFSHTRASASSSHSDFSVKEDNDV